VNVFFDRWQEKKFEPTKKAAVLSFDETRVRSQLFGLSKSEEKVRWERWMITLNVLKYAANDSQRSVFIFHYFYFLFVFFSSSPISSILVHLRLFHSSGEERQIGERFEICNDTSYQMGR